MSDYHDLKPRRARRTVSDDPDAMCVVTLLDGFAARVTAAVGTEPAIRPKDGMARLGSRDRASYVWFLPCTPSATSPDGSRPASCNHGIGIDRMYGAYEVRAWAHGAPTVHDVSLHTHMVTEDHLETAAKLIGLPFQPYPQERSFSDPEGA